jgi:hypothetical protein
VKPGTPGAPAAPAKPATLQSTLADRMTALMSDDPATWTPTTTELYDIDADPTQTTNLAAANPDVVNQLIDEIREYLKLAQPPGKPPTKGGSDTSSGGSSGASGLF